MLKTLLPARYRHAQLLKRLQHPVALAYLRTGLPPLDTPIPDVEFLSLDFETTGLNARHEAILSMGYVPISRQRILLRQARHQIIRINTPLPESSVAIHQITDDRMLAGTPLHDTLHELLEHMTGKVLLVHYAPIERSFLQAAMQRVYGAALPFAMVDTMDLAHRRLKQAQTVIAPNQLRLANLRQAYGLPRYGAHHALEDAIATAELFLALRADRSGGCLRDIIRHRE